MTLPLHIAFKLQEIIARGVAIPASAMKHAVVEKMLDDAVLQKIQTGKTKATIFVNDTPALAVYLHNVLGIPSLEEYIEKYSGENLTRGDAIAVSGNSKLRNIRTFKGFLVNSYQPLATSLHGGELIIYPPVGSYTFISDWESFQLNASITVVGIENAENFRNVWQMQYLFPGLNALFVCRYPYSSDLVSWLKRIPNPYLHFGDLDFEGIHIYLNEYKKHLKEKSSFFVPPNVEATLNKYGNRNLYDKQYNYREVAASIQEPPIATLIELIHKYKKVLEQEIFITGTGLSMQPWPGAIL